MHAMSEGFVVGCVSLPADRVDCASLMPPDLHDSKLALTKMETRKSRMGVTNAHEDFACQNRSEHLLDLNCPAVRVRSWRIRRCWWSGIDQTEDMSDFVRKLAGATRA